MDFELNNSRNNNNMQNPVSDPNDINSKSRQDEFKDNQ